jgi:hypothetical protein
VQTESRHACSWLLRLLLQRLQLLQQRRLQLLRQRRLQQRQRRLL